MLWGSFNGYKVALVQSLEDLAFIRSNLYANILVGCDSETTGLSFVSDYVVGVCLSTGRTYSKADYVGYYIPLRHYGYSRNLPIKEVMEFVQFVVDNYMTAWWNRSFDFSMLEKDGFKAPFVGKTHDIQFMAHEVFNDRMPKLKDWAKRFLKFQTISYEENEAENNDFASTDPEVSFIYSGGDPLMTALLGLKIWSDYPNIRKIYSLDNECGEAVRRMTQQEIYLDYDFLDAELRRSNAQMESLRQQIYQLVGYSFNVDSGPQIAEALGRFVTLTVRTERGGLKVDKNVLATIDHPLAKLLLEYSEVSTYIKSFVSKMCSWRGTPVRINYNLTVALTGRMSSSGSKGNDYYKPFNGQNCLRGSTVVYSDTGAIHLDSVSVGSRVWDGVAFREVTAFYNKGVQDVYRVTLDNGRSIDATLDHPILTKSGFRPVSELLGVFVALSGFVVPNGLDAQDMSTFSWQKVVSISYIGRDVVYDITVSTTHRFAANGIIVHNCPKVEVKAYLHTHPVLGYCLTDSPDGAVCDSDGNPIKYKTKAGLRSAFMPAPKDDADWVVLGADFAAQEIRVAGNLSREDGFLYPVKHNIDVHLYVAEKRFGVSDPGFRSKSKAVSFGKLYGGGPHLIASRLSISVQAAKELISDYDKGMPRLKAWQEVLKRDAKRTGFARTYFGRTIYLAKWLSSPDNGMRAYAERVSLNAPVQGSLINTIYLPSQDGKSYRPWKDFAGQRVDFVDPLSGVRRMGVPTFRGEEELHVVIFNTGDFVVCNRGHKFVKYGTDDVVIDLDSCGRIPVRMGKPFKRPRLSWLRGLFSRGEFSLEQLAALAHMGRPIAVDDWGIYWGLLKSFLGGKRFHTRSFITAATLRSVCDLFGWNLVYDFAASSSTDYVFKLCRGRKLKAHAVFAMPLGVTHNIMSPSMCSGLPVYPLCGFVHKNTGGDLIRRDLIRLMRYRDMDPEFAANTRFVVTVHDEIQIASRIPYLAKAVCILQRIMNFWPSNFEVPLVTEPCVGLTWGYELDIHAVDKKTGKLWPKDFTPPQEYIDSGDWYFVDSWLEQEKAKRGVSW
jgi:DNA polymerase I-like protein with 3'-5' exonuclease and polymerase domains